MVIPHYKDVCINSIKVEKASKQKKNKKRVSNKWFFRSFIYRILLFINTVRGICSRHDDQTISISFSKKSLEVNQLYSP